MNRKDASIVINSLLREKSGSINIDGKLVDFLYILMRDHLPAGTVESLVREVEIDSASNDCEINEYSNGWLALYAKNLSDRLTKDLELVEAAKNLSKTAEEIIDYVDDCDIEGINRLDSLRESLNQIKQVLKKYD